MNKRIALLIEEMNKLTELGIDTSDATMKYELCSGNFGTLDIQLTFNNNGKLDYPNDGESFAYTFQDIVNKLPSSIKMNGYVYELVVKKYIVGYYLDSAVHGTDDLHYAMSFFVNNGNILNALYKLLLWYIKDYEK